MNTTDPIADMLTRIRNANSSKHKTVDIPASKMKLAIADILFKEGYIKSFEEISSDVQGTIKVALKYDEKGNRVIAGIKRISKPGLRVYASKEDLPEVLNGLGIAIVSTSKGVMTDKEARKAGLGGEVLAYVW
ncbi:MAG: 30S ribosomal protein S8 [Clostridia bacterium]|nr:30S ribosomal protein S8 [Clostridia bacterium]